MDINWGQIAGYGPTVILLALILFFLLKAMPTWREIRLRELDLRGDENKIKSEQATALAKLGDALTAVSEVLQAVTIEQRKATENIEILQRVNADSADQLSRTVRALMGRVDNLDEWRMSLNSSNQQTQSQSHAT